MIIPVLAGRRVSAPAFSPNDLSPLAFWDVSQPGTVFQDTAGATPATDDGQFVGCLKDAYGRTAFDISFGSAAKRPLLRVSGGLRWLQFDGVDDSGATAGNVTLPVENTIMMATNVVANVRILVELSPNSNASNGFSLSPSTGATYSVRIGAVHLGNANSSTWGGGLAVIGSRYLSGAFSFEANGVSRSGGTTTGTAKSGDATNILYFFGRGGASLFAQGNFYAGGIFPASVGFDAQLRTWLGNKAGLTL